MILNPVSSPRMPWSYAETANDDAEYDTGGRRYERVEIFKTDNY